MNQFKLLINTLSAIAVGITLISPAKANAQWMDFGKGVIDEWGEAIRSNTVGRLAGQEFVGDMSMAEIEALKAKYGGDYHAKVTDWCNNKVIDRVGQNRANAIVPGVSSTWRIENDKANCYWRKFGSN